ncbi:MAG: hypothetical protein HY698_11325, partial [Deltaproteobacteria bacterium]|nr:hypothetical protein [Deltaproteobacteria bacterium]
GGGDLVLYGRGGEYVIRVDGFELMSSRAHGSEEHLARLACARLADRTDARVLVGGLGMGYTLRAALDSVSGHASVTVAELIPAVVDWNRGPLGDLAGHPLDDPRVTVVVDDVGAVLRKAAVRFDAILLDVDNGPVALTRKANQVLYSEPGLAVAKRALRAGGKLAIWSASGDARFEQRLRRAGFAVESHQVPARGASGGPMHTIFLGSVGAAVACLR